jgi:hypothetical protein
VIRIDVIRGDVTCVIVRETLCCDAIAGCLAMRHTVKFRFLYNGAARYWGADQGHGQGW